MPKVFTSMLGIEGPYSYKENTLPMSHFPAPDNCLIFLQVTRVCKTIMDPTKNSVLSSLC